MESFNYLSVLISIILGLAIAQVLQGVRGLVVLYGRLPHPLDLSFQLVFGVIAITAMLLRWEWFHRLLAPVSGVLFLLYIALIFRNLHQ